MILEDGAASSHRTGGGAAVCGGFGDGAGGEALFPAGMYGKSDVIFREPPEDGRLPLYRERSARILKPGGGQRIPSKVRTGERNGDAG